MVKGNDAQAQAGLAQVGAAIRDGVEAAVAECAETIAEQAREDCPAASGRLRESIGVEMRVDPGSGMIEARVSADTPYAAAVELGSGKTPPRPFLFPALERLGPILVRALLDLMRR